MSEKAPYDIQAFKGLLDHADKQYSNGYQDGQILNVGGQKMAIDYAVRFLINEIADLDKILNNGNVPNRKIIESLRKEYKKDLLYFNQFIE